MENIKQNKYIKLLIGIISSMILTLIGLLIYSIILACTSLSEATEPIVIIAISFVSILISSTITVRKCAKNGMINGGIIGGTYILILYIISSSLNTGFNVNIYTIFMIILGIVAGLIGGIIGINSWNLT